MLNLLPYICSIIIMLAGLYSMMAYPSLLRKLIGLGVVQTGMFLFFIVMGKMPNGTVPILSPSATVYSSPLPQVLMLTAIVVGVATLALGAALYVGIEEIDPFEKQGSES